MLETLDRSVIWWKTDIGYLSLYEGKAIYCLVLPVFVNKPDTMLVGSSYIFSANDKEMLQWLVMVEKGIKFEWLDVRERFKNREMFMQIFPWYKPYPKFMEEIKPFEKGELGSVENQLKLREFIYSLYRSYGKRNDFFRAFNEYSPATNTLFICAGEMGIERFLMHTSYFSAIALYSLIKKESFYDLIKEDPFKIFKGTAWEAYAASTGLLYKRLFEKAEEGEGIEAAVRSWRERLSVVG